MRWRALIAALALAGMQNSSLAADALTLERKIPLGEVVGRIDHMAIDLARHRLFVAELGNDTVGVVDIDGGAVAHRIAGLKEPQGVGYVAAADALYVANAGDGSLRRFRGSDYVPEGTLALGDDADNIRVTRDGTALVVGYGAGALAILDAASANKVGDIALSGHPEGFQLDPANARIYVNVPDAREVAVVDRAAAKQVAKWTLPGADNNFPMALDASGKRLFVGYRRPAVLGVFDTPSGTLIERLPICGDTDDVFFDEKRRRLYVSCGEGALDIFEEQAAKFLPLQRIATVSGARTSLWVPELDRLFVAIRARGGEPAAIWVYRP